MLRWLFLIFWLHLQMLQTGIAIEVFWNMPTEKCMKKYNVSIPLSKFDIRANEGQSFFGEQVVLLYGEKFGNYPRITAEGIDINGGIPQKVDMAMHLQKVHKDIEQAIPNANFNGIGVIDFEEWRPLWSLNWGAKKVYKQRSLADVQRRMPKMSDKSARQLAANEFNDAAKNFMLKTLKYARQQRPRARWGFYGFPYCNYDAGYDGSTCSGDFQEHNDKMNFLLNETSALFPSIYLYNSEEKNDSNFRYSQAVVAESVRIGDKLKLPIYVYTRFSYDPYTDKSMPVYTKHDLCNTVDQPAYMGVDGLVIWSTSTNMDKKRCAQIADYVNGTYGPTIRSVRDNTHKCSETYCEKKEAKCVWNGQKKCELEPYSHPYTCK